MNITWNAQTRNWRLRTIQRRENGVSFSDGIWIVKHRSLRCTRCLEEDKSCKYALPALLTRSSAFVKCGRLEEGLFDADSALKEHPKSAEAHTRRAEALVEMKKHWDAAEAYHQIVKYGERKQKTLDCQIENSWALGSTEGESYIWKCLQHMTVDDISTQICCIFTKESKNGLLSKPCVEQLSESDLEAAVYK